MDGAELAERLISGDRRALARAITLVESGRPDHRAAALDLLDRVAAAGRQALRLGLSGAPGVGKSSFVERFGGLVTGAGLRLAVLAIDPSSARSGGSILGDKTRMETLARDPRAFVRPSPSGGALGGVAPRTGEAVALCEGAGFDVVLVETVGVGQSETAVAEMTDVFVLLLAPAGGDELQGVKRGIMELADLVLVNKADGALRAAALQTVADYAGALRLLRPRAIDPPGFPKVLPVSAATGEGLAEAWGEIRALADWRRARSHWAARRAAQARAAFEAEVRAGLLARLTAGAAAARMAALAAEVEAGRLPPARAAAELLAGLGAGGSARDEPLDPGAGIA